MERHEVTFRVFLVVYSGVLNLFNNSLECGGIVQCKVGEDFAVDFDTCLVDEAHELGVRKILKTGCSVDTLDPQRAEVTLLVLAVTVGIGKTFFPSVLGYGPHVAAATEVSAGKFQNFLAASS